MSYSTFHLVFTIPPVILLAATLPQSFSSFGGWRARIAIPLLALIAFTYTTPWDNYLVAQAVWWYGPERTLGAVGTVPLEEYFFFLIQPVLTGLFCFHYLMRGPSVKETGGGAVWSGFLLFGLLSVAGGVLLLLPFDGPFYLGLILSWSPPLLAGMWLYDGETLWRHRATLLYCVGVPTMYLWIADAFAIHSGIWTISDQYTLGFEFFGLPLEEALFFLMTNLLVVKGILLLLRGSHEALNRTRLDAAGVKTRH